jgi:hypothetical protein
MRFKPHPLRLRFFWKLETVSFAITFTGLPRSIGRERIPSASPGAFAPKVNNSLVFLKCGIKIIH